MNPDPTACRAGAAAKASWKLAGLEIMAILGVFMILGGAPPPDVNEAHYLAKAKHYWNPDWLAGDVFLESSDAHAVFYWTFGWLTLLLPLPAVAVVGRLLTWTLLAWSWRRLSWQLAPRPFYAILTAALFALAIEHFHLAGEWIIGGVEAKGFAYVCVFLGLEALAKGKWSRALIAMGGAAAFHVLVGGWALAAMAGAWIASGRDRPPLKSMAPAALLAIVLSLPGLIPALMLSHGVDADTAARAHRIYVAGRLPHHLVFHRFDHWYMARHALLLAAVIAAAHWWWKQDLVEARHRRLAGFLAGCLGLALCGIAIDQGLLYFRDLANALLRYYWFRLSDVMLPAAAALLSVMIAARLVRTRPAAGAIGFLLLAAIAAAGLVAKFVEHRVDHRPGADAQTLPSFANDPERTALVYEDWKRVTAWIDRHTPADALFLTPRMQQTFKWYADRKEVVSWKDVPQDAAGIVDWWGRYNDVYRHSLLKGGLAARSDRQLRELAESYGADYIVIDRSFARRPIGLAKVYPRWPEWNATYEVYRVGEARRP